ncbi:hypothetical protein M1O17_04065, partial [Dehalococcoidia bacterium]|nr:hypothetical protein [Dehalococcoidia bacterium]
MPLLYLPEEDISIELHRGHYHKASTVNPFALLIHPLAYGNLIWLVSIATILSTLCTFGLGKTVITHLPAEKDGKLLSSSVAVVFGSHLLALGIGIVGIILLGRAFGLLGSIGAQRPQIEIDGNVVRG